MNFFVLIINITDSSNFKFEYQQPNGELRLLYLFTVYCVKSKIWHQPFAYMSTVNTDLKVRIEFFVIMVY